MSSLSHVGQRCVSEREPELGLGVVTALDRQRITVSFPASGEQRIYTRSTPVLKRVQFRAGETVATREGAEFGIETVREEAGLLVYSGSGHTAREDAISDVSSTRLPQARLLSGQVDDGEVFDLRYRALQAQLKFRQSPVRGFLGGRLELIPHQFYILREVASRPVPRVLLADEVGLGKTIEACLILQRLLAVGRAKRVLILVPESLVHQWFVELLRRFNLWFSIIDEARCLAGANTDPQGNPFLGAQLALCSVAFLARDPERGAQAVAAGWDVVVVDEAHHLAWSPDAASAEYTLVEQLAQRAPGLLLLTATPTQLGRPGHFARLRLLDPDRYNDYDAFVEETEAFGTVAAVAEKIVEAKPLTAKDQTALKEIFRRDPEGLARHLTALEQGLAGAREGLLRSLLDQHGPGRVMFRNTRAAIAGFPKRQFCPWKLEPAAATTALSDKDSKDRKDDGGFEDEEEGTESEAPVIISPKARYIRIARELEAEETGRDSEVRYSFKDDPRIAWLVAFLKEDPARKVLLICRTQRKVSAIAAALQDRINVKVALFHEGLPLVQRDRNAAWFAEPEGARLLLCSEIGSEGRNFQFAHHLVLFDLPLNPGLVEQRIGRLDRIGQMETIRVHVPYVAGSAEECIVEWYHRGLNAFEAPLHSGTEFQDRFREPLLAIALARRGEKPGQGDTAALEKLIAETAGFRRELATKMQRGRDRLLELSSFNEPLALETIDAVRAADGDPFVRRFLLELLDHFGVRVKEFEEGDVHLDPSHAYVEGFPSIPADGMLATFDRRRAIAREDIRFLSPDHALVRDATDLLLNSARGTTAFSRVDAEEPNLLLEAIFVLECVADTRWHVDQFLAPTPIRVVVDVRGGDLTEERPAGEWDDGGFDENAIQRFLEKPGFNAAVMKEFVDNATEQAEASAAKLKRDAKAAATATLGAELQRLVTLRKLNDHVRAEEIELAQERLTQTSAALEKSRLRLDAVRLVVEGGD